MGRVIRKGAAAKDIFADVRTTLTNAAARGEPYKTPAEQKLGPMLAAVDILEAKYEVAATELGPKLSTVDAADDDADALIGATADNVWNAIGRPAFDPGYELVFPGGISYYTRGPDIEQPERMKLLAELLEAGLITKLESAAAAEYAAPILATADDYQQKLDAVRGPRARVSLLDRVRTALARGAQRELSRLKRIYLANDLSEADIHKVIPDRPRVASPQEPPAAT